MFQTVTIGFLIQHYGGNTVKGNKTIPRALLIKNIKKLVLYCNSQFLIITF